MKGRYVLRREKEAISTTGLCCVKLKLGKEITESRWEQDIYTIDLLCNTETGQGDHGVKMGAGHLHYRPVV